jgi:ABC-type transport system involved in multi-copper enzyme maturation permease subunit
MNAILALILDSYRELHAKRLFWVSLIFSAIFVLAFAGVDLRRDGLYLFGWKSPLEFTLGFYSPAAFYKLMYVNIGIRLWVTWAGMILAVASTAGMFPDFLASGSVDLYLARPITRLRLYLVKYTCGLLFVALQVGVFSAACFLVIGLRGNVWEPGLLLAVPMAVLLFSYLFSFCALLGVLTRSTVTALLGTLIFWMLLAAMQTTETALLRAQIADHAMADRLDRQITFVQQELQDAPATQPAAAASPATAPAPGPVSYWTSNFINMFGRSQPMSRESLQDRLVRLQAQRATITNAYDRPHEVVYLLDLPLPKTHETVELLERVLLSAARLPRGIAEEGAIDPSGFGARRSDREYAGAEVDRELRSRSAGWIVGSSLGFEFLVVGLGAWLFCRRDY